MGSFDGMNSGIFFEPTNESALVVVKVSFIFFSFKYFCSFFSVQ